MPISAVMRPAAKVSPSTQLGWSASCWRTNGSAPVGGVKNGTCQPAERAAVIAAAIVGGRPQTRTAVAPARRARSSCGPRSSASAGTVSVECDRRSVLRERRAKRDSAGRAVVRVVGDDRDLEMLRDQVLGQPERDAVVARRDPEHIPPRLRVDDPFAALEDDADRHACVSRDPPGRIDAGALVDDRDRVLGDRAPDVRDGAGGGERAVECLDLQVVRHSADADALRVDLASGEPRAVLDRPAEIRGARERRVDGDRERAPRRRRAAAAAR